MIKELKLQEVPLREREPTQRRKTTMKTKKIKQYTIITGEILGEGAFGTVYRAYFTENKKKQFACKKVPLQQKEQSSDFCKALKREIDILKELNSEHIVKLQDVVSSSTSLYIFMELCLEGDLSQVLKNKPKKRLSEEETIQYFKHIIQAFKEMNQKKIIHRDMKPQNVLLSQGIAKIADFGFSRKLESEINDPANMSRVGTPLYMSPQILQGQEFSDKCDVWSVGVMIYQLLYGRTPWTGKSQFQLLNSIRSQKLKFADSPYRSDNIKKLLTNMLKIHEKDRYSWEQVFNDPVFQCQQKYLRNSSIMLSSVASVGRNINISQNLNKRVQGYLKDVEPEENEIPEENVPFCTCQSMILECPESAIAPKREILQIYSYTLYNRNISKFLTSITQKFHESYHSLLHLKIPKEKYHSILLLISLHENSYLHHLRELLTAQTNPHFDSSLWQKFKSTIESYKITSLLDQDLNQSAEFLDKVFKDAEEFVKDEKLKKFFKQQQNLYEQNKGKKIGNTICSNTTNGVPLSPTKPQLRHKNSNPNNNNGKKKGEYRRNTLNVQQMDLIRNLQQFQFQQQELVSQQLDDNVISNTKSNLDKYLKIYVILFLKGLQDKFEDMYEDDLGLLKYMLISLDFEKVFKNNWNFDFCAFYEDIDNEGKGSIIKFIQQNV